MILCRLPHAHVSYHVHDGRSIWLSLRFPVLLQAPYATLNVHEVVARGAGVAKSWVCLVLLA